MRYSNVLYDISHTSRYLRILKGTIGYFKLLQDISAWYRILKVSSEYFTYFNILHIVQNTSVTRNISKYFSIFQGIPRYFKTLYDASCTSGYFIYNTLRFFTSFRMFQVTSGYFKLPPHISRYFRIVYFLQNALYTLEYFKEISNIPRHCMIFQSNLRYSKVLHDIAYALKCCRIFWGT